jgi:hypothetical protein
MRPYELFIIIFIVIILGSSILCFAFFAPASESTTIKVMALSAIATVIYSAFVYYQLIHTRETLDLHKKEIILSQEPVVFAELDGFELKYEKERREWSLHSKLLIDNYGRGVASPVIIRVHLDIYQRDEHSYDNSNINSGDRMIFAMKADSSETMDINSCPFKFRENSMDSEDLMLIHIVCMYRSLLDEWYKTTIEYKKEIYKLGNNNIDEVFRFPNSSYKKIPPKVDKCIGVKKVKEEIIEVWKNSGSSEIIEFVRDLEDNQKE